MSEIPSPVDGQGELRWSKLDIDLQGQNLISDFAVLQSALLEARSKNELSWDELNELMRLSTVVASAIGNLQRRVRYVRRTPMIERILKLLGRPPESSQAGHAALQKLSSADLKRLHDQAESHVETMSGALMSWLKPEARDILFGP